MEGNDSCLNHWKSEIMPEKKCGELRGSISLFGENSRMEEEKENQKKKYIDSQTGKRFL